MKASTLSILGGGLALTLLTVLHGALNHGWLADRTRARLTVAHLPVT